MTLTALPSIERHPMNTVPRLSYDRAIKRGTENDIVPTILPATHGNFSTPFFRRVKFALELTGGVVEHVVSLHTARGGKSDDNVQASKDDPLPFNAQAWDDANEMYRRLVYWSLAFSEGLTVAAPGPARRAWRNNRGRVVGFPASVSPAEARYAAGVMTKWLVIQLEKIMSLDVEDVTLFSVDITDVFRVNARWPQRDRSSWSKLPCPHCKGRLAIWPPEGENDRRRIVCEVCRNDLEEDEYEVLVEEMAKATKEAIKLATKYATRARWMAGKTEEPPTAADLRSRA
jgi:hypothetical protein